MLILVKHQKKSTVTSSSDLRKRGQGSKKVKNGVKLWTILNGKSNTAKVLVGVKHQKVSTVTPSPDIWLRGPRSKKVKSLTTWNDKSNTVNVLILVKHQKSQWWPLHPTYRKEINSFFLTMIASSSTCLIGCLPKLVRACMGGSLQNLWV